MTKTQKLGLLATLYFAQGLPFGFFTQALPVLMRKQGLSLTTISLASLLSLPWALKFLWAPLVDRYGSATFGRRRSWILPLQALAILVIGVLSLLEPHEQSLTPMLVAVLLTNLIAATQDIPTDGLAVELLDERERGDGNGVQVAAYRVGMIVGGGALLYVFGWVGWRATFGAMAALLALATVPIALHRERPARAPALAVKPGAAAWIRVLKRPGMLPWIGLLAIFKAGDYLASAMVRPMFVDHGMSLNDIALLLGTVGFVAGLVGAGLGGYAATRFGRKRALLGCGMFQILSIAGYIPAAMGIGGAASLAVASTVEHLAGGMATVALFTMMMDASGEETAATDYTVQACVVVGATGVCSLLSGPIAQAVGYPIHFAISTVVAVVGVVVAAVAFARGSLPPPTPPRSSSLSR